MDGAKDMMNEHDVVELLKMIDNIGVDVWIDGGWGVDALLGFQSRQRNDLDIFIEKRNMKTFIEMLLSQNYTEVKMKYTTNDHTVWKDSFNRVVDLHVFEFGEGETLLFDNVSYPTDLFAGKGTIGGISVRCLSLENQLLYHQGYEHDEDDTHDVLLLCKTFGLEVPKEYRCNE